ncbi:MAG: hypothetical protein DMF81_10060 [Acidobacteria bacterium]|nr:MAG: hypothetical protein DMF81_10060 [Acidobacteriota bacterium]
MITAGMTLAAAALGAGTYMFAVRQGWLRYNKYDRREEGSIRVGDYAPSLALVGYDGVPVKLGRLWAERPLVLVFGSCT